MTTFRSGATTSKPGTSTIGPGTSVAGSGTSQEEHVVVLPPPCTRGTVSLEEAIRARRSVRKFTAQPLLLEEVGQLLWAAQGVTSPQGARAAPSAGGTYPLELYVVVGSVTGLDPGVYHYRPGAHCLLRVAAGDSREQLAAASLDQEWVARAAIDVVVAAVYSRTTERYGERGIRYVHLEAGHTAQNLCLQATVLGLGAVTVGAFSDQQVSDVVGMPPDHSPVYVIPVGRPSPP